MDAVITDCVAVGVNLSLSFSYGDKILQCNGFARHLKKTCLVTK